MGTSLEGRYRFITLLSFSAGKSLWELVAEQFEDLLVRILLLAACISFVSVLRSLHTFCCLLVFVLPLLDYSDGQTIIRTDLSGHLNRCQMSSCTNWAEKWRELLIEPEFQN